MFYSFEGMKPVVHPKAYVHERATIIGDVWIGADVYIGPGAVLRGDWGRITVERGSNVQENCIIHVFPGKDVLLKEGSHIGHGAVIHGATIEPNCLVGMNAVVMDDAVIGKESIIGALTFIKQGTKVPQRSVYAGNPGKKVKDVSDEMLKWKTEGTQWYKNLPESYRESLLSCEPLAEDKRSRPRGKGGFSPLKSS
jgi:phenylacetic acid degradation protein/carnitine operon protein CaiE